jgi:ABC-2 type transport system permease protein
MKRYEFSPARFRAIVVKEFIQMRRDRLTFAMMIMIPLMQLILFGYAINSDPRHLPAAILLADNGPYGRTLLYAIKNSTYFDFVRQIKSEQEGRDALARGEVQFVISIPENFTRDLVRGDRPSVLIEADATDPAATSNAIGSLNSLLNVAFANDFKGPLSFLGGGPPAYAGIDALHTNMENSASGQATVSAPIDVRIHAMYNPEAITQYNIVPGLMGVVLTMTMVLITGMAITRERERGTMENLLSMPTRPFEVMAGKIIPYILVGYVQVSLILIASHLLFHVPVEGSLFLLMTVALAFIAANLAVGITFSTVAENQLQAMQMAFFFFLPSILLSGFMFPFRGMPVWAQYIGEILPLTHFLRIVRGIMLKGNSLSDVVFHLWKILLFTVVALVIGVKRYRRTLD